MTWLSDEAVGKVVDKLRSTDLEQDTLIFFCSDNGGPTVGRTALQWIAQYTITPLKGINARRGHPGTVRGLVERQTSGRQSL